MVLGEARHGEVPAELLDVVSRGSEEVDGLEVRHGLPGAGGIVHRLHEEHLLPQQIRLAVHHAHHPDGLGVEDEDLHSRDVVEHAVDVVADERDQHHCCCGGWFFEFGINFALGGGAQAAVESGGGSWQRADGGARGSAGVRWRELRGGGGAPAAAGSEIGRAHV